MNRDGLIVDMVYLALWEDEIKIRKLLRQWQFNGEVIGIGHTPIVCIDGSVPTVYYKLDASGCIYCRNIGSHVVQHFQYKRSIYPPVWVTIMDNPNHCHGGNSRSTLYKYKGKHIKASRALAIVMERSVTWDNTFGGCVNTGLKCDLK